LPVILARIDDRLIHGQVTVAWGGWLEPDRMILVNDEIATSEWRRELYAEADSLGAAVSVLTKSDFLKELEKGRWDDERVILIVESPADMLDLIVGGLVIESVNVGGMHFSPGRREVLSYVYVNDEDIAAMRSIVERGVGLTAQDVPQTQPVDLRKALERP
jgi:mannose/fructose/N-acetylgalactosamine-specific phosphotransferase system component IIB